MALCLADSLASQDGPDAADQVARYCDWQRNGLWSSTGSCVGISAATAARSRLRSGPAIPYAGSHDPAHADAEPLARIGPAVAWFQRVAARGDRRGGQLRARDAPGAAHARRRSPARRACSPGALAGAGKDTLLAADFSPDPRRLRPDSLRSPVRELAAGAWRGRARAGCCAASSRPSPRSNRRSRLRGRGRLAQCLAAAASRPGDAATARRDRRPARGRALRRARRCRRNRAQRSRAPTRSRRSPTGCSTPRRARGGA